MQKFNPDEHEENRSVAPLVQFFELVHIGDTIQSMVQVYFDKELVRPRVPYSKRLLIQEQPRHLTSTELIS